MTSLLVFLITLLYLCDCKKLQHEHGFRGQSIAKLPQNVCITFRNNMEATIEILEKYFQVRMKRIVSGTIISFFIFFASPMACYVWLFNHYSSGRARNWCKDISSSQLCFSQSILDFEFPRFELSCFFLLISFASSCKKYWLLFSLAPWLKSETIISTCLYIYYYLKDFEQYLLSQPNLSHYVHRTYNRGIICLLCRHVMK